MAKPRKPVNRARRRAIREQMAATGRPYTAAARQHDVERERTTFILTSAATAAVAEQTARAVQAVAVSGVTRHWSDQIGAAARAITESGVGQQWSAAAWVTQQWSDALAASGVTQQWSAAAGASQQWGDLLAASQLPQQLNEIGAAVREMAAQIAVPTAALGSLAQAAARSSAWANWTSPAPGD